MHAYLYRPITTVTFVAPAVYLNSCACSLQGMYIMFHYIKGTPYPTGDQGDARRLTNWEQIDNGEQMTDTRKFLIAVPVLL